MKLPDFPLASWEMPPDSEIPLLAPADLSIWARWRGRETELLIRAVNFNGKESLFFRELASDEVGNWLLPDSNIIEEQYIDWATETYKSERIRFSPELCWRLFFLNGARYGVSGIHKLLVTHDDGMWLWQNKVSSFTLPQWGEQFYHWRAAQVGRMVRRELENSESDVGYAFDWLHWNETEKQSRLFGVSCQTLERMEMLMISLLRLQTFLPTVITQETHTWRMAFGASDKTLESPTFQTLESDAVYMNSSGVSSRLKKWGNLFSQHLLRESNYDSKACVRSLPYKWLSVTIAPPSAHEKLEAQLKLRQWCEEVGAQNEFADLVGTSSV